MTVLPIYPDATVLPIDPGVIVLPIDPGATVLPIDPGASPQKVCGILKVIAITRNRWYAPDRRFYPSISD